MSSNIATVEPADSKPPTLRRRWWLTMSLQSLMILVLIVGGVLGWQARRASLQRRAVALIQAKGGHVEYEDRREISTVCTFPGSTQPAVLPGPPSPASGGTPTPLTDLVQPAILSGPPPPASEETQADPVSLPGAGPFQIQPAGLSEPLFPAPGGIPAIDARLSGPGEPHWLRRWLGDEYFREVYRVSLPEFFDLADEDVATISQLTSLHDLDIGYVGSGDRHLPRLPKLDIVGGQAATGAVIAPLIERNPGLLHVNWTGGTVDGRTLAALGRLTGLVGLHLRETRLDDEALAGLTPAAKLRELTLAGAPIGDAGLAHLAQLPQLRYLDLRQTRVTNAGMDHLNGLTNLTDLILDETAIDDAALVALHPRIVALNLLSLSDTRITDAGVATLTDANQLMTLDLGGTRVTDASLHVLGGLPQLHGLDLTEAGTTAAGEASFAATRPRLSLLGHPQQVPPGW